MLHRSVLLSLVLISVSPNPLKAQSSAVSDAQGLSLAARSIAALTGNAPVKDVAITGTATWFGEGHNETAAVTLSAKGTTESVIQIKLPGGTRTETRNNIGGLPQGKWLNSDGSTGLYAMHNCWTDAVWFFPALSSLANFASSAYVFSYLGSETWNGLNTLHLRVYQQSSTLKEISRLSAMDYYLDPQTLLPLGMVFNVHSDKDSNRNIPAEVLFADYQRVNGIYVPFQIQRLQSGAVFLDIKLTNATFNSGLSENIFSIQ
jgi:hypothetical protein